jgi:septal ring factor EnvC (AmiA/AmiB activator)
MVTRSKFASTLALATLVLAVPVLARAAADPKAAEKVAQGMLKFDQSITTASTQIETTLTAMNALSQPGANLTDAYKNFTKQVDALGKVADKAKANSQAATQKRDAYLKQWQESQAGIQNAQLKAASEARRAELMPKIEAIKASLTSASTTFKPFHQDLKDLTVFLANALNPAGIASANELMTKCNTDGASVKADLAKASAAVKDLAASIQPGGPAPAK